MRSRTVYLLHVAFAVLLLSAAAPAHAVPVMINNGLAPPNPENVIDGADSYGYRDFVYVRNVGCPTGWPAVVPRGPCASPGAATEVEVVSGGSVGDDLRVYDSSTVTMSGGTATVLRAYDSSNITMSGGTMSNGLYTYDSSTVTMSDGSVGQILYARHSSTVTMSGGSANYVYALDSSTVTMSGGTVNSGLEANHSSTITISGGTVVGDLNASESSIITISGIDFMVDGTPVPFGDLSALTGTLTGTLTNGGSLDNVFYQGGYAGTYTGVIRLIPEPSTASLLGLGLVGLAATRRRRAA